MMFWAFFGLSLAGSLKERAVLFCSFNTVLHKDQKPEETWRVTAAVPLPYYTQRPWIACFPPVREQIPHVDKAAQKDAEREIRVGV